MVLGNTRKMFLRVLVVSALFVCIPYVTAWAQGDQAPTSYQFALVIGNVTVGYFSEVSGIGSQTEVISRNVVDARGRRVLRKMPGDLMFLDVTLKRGISSDPFIWNWRQQVVNGLMNQARKNFSIIMVDETLQEMARWDFVNGWPIKVEASFSPPDGNLLPIETLVITHEGLQRFIGAQGSRQQ